MAWWISFTPIHTKAAPFNQSRKGFCMSQSQNAIFKSRTGEENLMSCDHRDSESITGEFTLIMLKCYFLQDNVQIPHSHLCDLLWWNPSLTLHPGGPETEWRKSVHPRSPLTLVESAFSSVLCALLPYVHWAPARKNWLTCVYVLCTHLTTDPGTLEALGI